MLLDTDKFKNAKCREPIPLICSFCSSVFYKPKNEIQKVLKGNRTDKFEYCSKNCHSLAGSQEVECLECHTKFRKRNSQIVKTQNHFCSRSCAASFNNKHYPKKTKQQTNDQRTKQIKSVNELPSHKQCIKCHTILPNDAKHFHNRANGKTDNKCKQCHNSIMKVKRHNHKKLCLDYKKTHCCSICGYNRNIAALEFHHVNPDEKEFQIKSRCAKQVSKAIKQELDKCIVVCSNCHAEIHSPN